MITRRALLSVGLVLALGAAAADSQAQQRVLRLDQSAPGRLDPSKVVDYASSVLAMNAYDTLVNGDPKSRRGAEPRRELDDRARRQELHLQAADRREVPRRRRADRRGRRVLAGAHAGAERRLRAAVQRHQGGGVRRADRDVHAARAQRGVPRHAGPPAGHPEVAGDEEHQARQLRRQGRLRRGVPRRQRRRVGRVPRGRAQPAGADRAGQGPGLLRGSPAEVAGHGAHPLRRGARHRAHADGAARVRGDQPVDPAGDQAGAGRVRGHGPGRRARLRLLHHADEHAAPADRRRRVPPRRRARHRLRGADRPR